MIRRGEYGKRIIAGKRTFSFTILVCIICWMAGYINDIGFPFVYSTNTLPLWKVFCSVIPNKETAYTIGFILMFGGAFLIHRTNYVLGLIREKTVLPFLFFTLFISTNPDFFPLKSTSVGVFCMVFGMYQLLLSYHVPDSRKKAFNWAFLIGIGSLFWIHIIWFIPLFWFGMYHLRSLSIRSFMSSVFGFISVYWGVLGWCVWQNNYTPFTHSFGTLMDVKLMIFNGGLWESIYLGYVMLLMLVASLHILTHEYEDNLRTREYLSFLIIFAVWAFLLHFLYDYSSDEFLIAACIPVSILAGHFFTVTWGKWISWLFYFTVLLFISILFIRLWQN